ncbi:MAG: hypothetical protein E7254_06625 [Lachnospiraceae bacterium]|nr:hypothetical protein [Lachnospiraceae bacterium]
MRKTINNRKKITKRIVSITLALTLVFAGLPTDMISENAIDIGGLVKKVKAAGELEELKARFTGHFYTFTSEQTDFSDYSKCFQDSSWAAEHAEDTITLNPVGGSFLFDTNYNPIGNSSAPFDGTVYFNTNASDFAVVANAPIFDYVKDSVKMYRLGTSTGVPININRAADVGDSLSALFANHVVGSSAASPYEWGIILNSSSVKSYSGVIGEMITGAKVNLTFTDNSNHTPQKDSNDVIISGSIIDNKESNKSYGILCGAIKGSSVLQATYTKTNNDNVTFVGTQTAYCGGLVGELNNSTFELLNGSSDLKVDFQTAKSQVGFVCGHAEGGTITLPSGYSISGSVDGTAYAGGIAGYCKNTVVNYETSSGAITLSNCTVHNGSNATATGGAFGYYESNSSANDILLSRTYSLSSCTVNSGKGYSGGIAGVYKTTYLAASTIDLDKYTDSSLSLSGTTAGGLFGKYTSSGSVTITDSNTSNTHFAPPSSSVAYGGIIGEYVNSSYTNTLTLTNFTINNLRCTSSGTVGGVIGTLNGSTYVSVDGVSVTNATADNTTKFGGIISTLDDSNAGSFIDVTGDYTLSMASGKSYKGGAIAYSFKKGVVRFAGVTDISGAKAASGYAQLIYENDETLVYAKGNGKNADWTLKRNAATTASDLGQWGEVLRMFTVNGAEKNAEEAGIVSVANNKVTVAAVTANPSITDEVSFAKVALNMQLNDGSNHGALCFATGGANKTALLSSDITITGIIDLAGTGLLGLTRDGGNGKYINSDNEFEESPDFFTGSISGTTGAETDKILLATGEAYGCDANGDAVASGSQGGRIYLSNGYGHDAQGLIAFGKGASFNDITIGGSMHVSRVAGSSDLYIAPLMGAMTNGATIENVTVDTVMTVDRADDAKFHIGGISGTFDGNETTGNPYTLSVTGCSITPSITLTGTVTGNESAGKYTYAGGVLGLLKGADSTRYNVSITNTDVSPSIIIDDNVTANPDYSYVAGMIGRVRKNTTNARVITLNTVTMTEARVDTRAKYPGGLLGTMWDETNVTINGLTITGSKVNHKYSGTGSKQCGLVFRGSGVWDIVSLTMQATTDVTPVNTAFASTDTNPASFGLIVNEAYSDSEGLYINLKNSGYSLTGVTVPTASSDSNYYVDEIAADTKNNGKNSGDIMIGGDGTGIININMNTGNGAKTKITDVDANDVENGTGTYQNKLYSQLGNLVGNPNSRYYYNLDVMLAKGTKGSTAPGGEKFLLWSVYNYAASNIRNNFKSNGNMISETTIDLSGLSYYPISGGDVTLPTGATVTFGFGAIKTYEGQSLTPDSWSRYPDNTAMAKTSATRRNQHYLMQTGLFTTVSSLTANTLILTGNFGYVAGVASGALINKSTSGSVSLTGLTLDKLMPSNSASYMLINEIDGTGTATPSLTLSNLRANNYSGAGVTLPVAQSLFGTATGKNMTMTFSNIKLDARDGNTITDTNWAADASTYSAAMDTAYGTSRSIFSQAIFFKTLLAAKTSNMEYKYAVAADWNTSTGPREVTYGKEISDSREYVGGEKRYFLEGEVDGNYTNPISNSNVEFDFSAGFLPYIGNYTDKGTNATYPITEIKVNYKAPGITEGCGTYNDPYIISAAAQLDAVAKAINGTAYPNVICLPNSFTTNHVSVSWHEGANGCGKYNLSGTNYNKASDNTGGLSNGTWTQTRVRYYLASAYYLIEGSFTLPDGFEGIGAPNDTNKGDTVFHGVIVGSSTSKPTITNPTNNPFIVVANGAVVKNIDIVNTANISEEETESGDSALYGYNGTNTDAKYYGGVIGEIMGGDNIIDDVSVTYTGTTTLTGTFKHLIAEGGMVGAVVNGALVFRGSNSVTGRNVTDGGIYSNQFVGRVINGYAIYEKISGRSGTAPDNYNETNEDENHNVTKKYTYSIDTIDRSNTNKLDVNYDDSTISVPDAQSFYIMSLITQSIASTANVSNNENYGAYSPSYGYNNYLYGVARLGDYSDVGCGKTAAKPTDYSSYAYRDSVNNKYSSNQDLVSSPTPYIIYKYTTSYENDSTITSKNYPARKMTSDNNKFWDITLSESDTFEEFDDFKAFRGIGCVGINPYSQKNPASRTAVKVATFEGNNNTIKLHISLPRYERNQENYYHKQNKSLTQEYIGDDLESVNYGHDDNLWQLMGLGLFDCVLVKNDANHEYQFQNITLQGSIEDVVYDASDNDITGNTAESQLFCVGGVVGKRVTYGTKNDQNNAYDTDNNFYNIKFDGITIKGAYSCGGLIGIDATRAMRKMRIDGCNSEQNGIGVTGGYYGKSNDESLRHGVGSFVGMTFWCRPYIDGETENDTSSNIYVSNVSTYYTGTANRCIVGGLIGYTGSGAEIKNINLYGLGATPVIGAQNVPNAAGFIGFSQAMNKTWADNDYIIIDNCTLNNISVRAKNNAAGFLARCGNAKSDWYPKYIKISNCAVIGDSQNKSEIRAYTAGSDNRCGAAGFVTDVSFNTSTPSDFSNNTSVIENCCITGYKIEGRNVGGILGAMSNKPIYLKNLYVKDCDIVTNSSNAGGGIVGYSGAKISGYNLKIDGVEFLKRNLSTDALTDNTSNSGIVLGGNSSSLVDRFIGIGAYNSTVSKVPTAVVKTNGTNTGNLFVFADYLNSSASDLTAGTGYASTFGVTLTNTVGQDELTYPSAPFVNTAPHIALGTGEYITGDGAGIGTTLGNAGEIYKDNKAGTSNRRYSIGDAAVTDSSVGNVKDSVTLTKYINDNGTYKDGAFKISTAAAEFGEDFTDLTGVNNFAMLVINDDTDKTGDITPFIKSYIRLVTNAAAGTPNSNTFNRYAYSCGNSTINQLYQVKITPCYYSSSAGKFVLGEEDDQGLQLYSDDDVTNGGKYWFDSTKADSESGNTCQFSLVDVQFKDPTDVNNVRVAYHLYVPVYTKKILTAEFSAVTMTGTTYSRTPYAGKIASEIAVPKTTSIIVESTNEWITTFIRYTYPKNQISSGYNWNFDKSIVLNLDGNFDTLPNGTKLILVDPNANADKYYTLTLDGTYATNTDITLNLSSFRDESGNPFSPQNLSAILADNSAWGTGSMHSNELYEDYYISMYVPNLSEGQTHSVIIKSGSLMTYTGGSEVQKANIELNLNSLVVLGDLFNHEITTNSFVVTSGDGNSMWDDNREMTSVNKVLKTEVTATVQIKNLSAGAFLANSDVYHAYYLTLTSRDADGKMSDIIYGITPGYIHNLTTISYTNSSGSHTESSTHSYLGANYVYLNSGSIRDALSDPTLTPVVTIHSVTTMTFNDITAFPFNVNGAAKVGTQLSVKSSVAYREEDLRYSALNAIEEDPDGKFYYSTTKNSAQLSFNAVPTDDNTDEIGLRTNNRSLLGVNGKYGTQHPIIGKAIYNVDDIVDYNSAEKVVYTISLYKKVTDNMGVTRYDQVDDIGDYMSNVNLTDSNSEVTLVADRSDPQTYVYTGEIDHGKQQDLDKMFEVDFNCIVLTGDAEHNEYSNYKVVLTADLDGATNAWKDSYIIYTNAKFDPSVIDNQ